MRRSRPLRDGVEYRRLWRIVEGAVQLAIDAHPDYIVDYRARASITKRVVGALQGHAAQAARSRSGADPAAVSGKRGSLGCPSSPPSACTREGRGEHANSPARGEG